MAKVDVLKTSFSAGEFGASLQGRVDVAQYDNACEIVENMIPRPYGSAISTPGTRLISECKLSELGTDSTVRIIPFVFNQTDAYVIEMGEKYMRFYTDRGAVLAGTGSTIYEIATSYSSIQLKDIQFTQQNDVIYMTHGSHKPQKLTRFGADDWTIEDFDYLGGPYLPDNLTDITITPSSATAGVTNATITLSATTSSIYFQAGHVGSLWKINGLVGDDNEQGYVKITSVSTSTIAIVEVMKALTDTSATKVWAEGAWSALRGYPARVQFHDGRLWFARTDFEPQGVWGSWLYTYDEFALNEQNDDQGITVKLSSNQSNEIQWLASGNTLVASTYGGAHVISSGSEMVITPTNLSANPEVSVGAEAIQPKRIGNFFYYVQRFGKKIRELFYVWDNDAYKAQDKTIYNPEVTGDGIVDMAYQEVTDTILWCVKEDGDIATLTREVDQEVQGWARQVTDGKYESICAIPSQSFGYDEVWVVVRREIDGEVKRYIEVFETLVVPERQDKCLYLHSALEYDAYEDTEAEDVDLTLSGTNGTITLTSSGAYFVEEDVGKRIRAIDADGVTLGEALITGYTSSTILVGTVKYAFDTTTYSAGDWGVSVEAISGLEHLEAKTVKVLADGGVDKPDKVVSSGTINLAYNYFVVTVGLPYTQKIYTLPFDAGSARGTSQGKKQRIYQVAFKLNRSYRGFKVGGNADMAERVSFREPSTLLGTPEELFTGTLANINFKDDWRYGSQVYVENDEPFPIEILSIMCQMETQDK